MSKSAWPISAIAIRTLTIGLGVMFFLKQAGFSPEPLAEPVVLFGAAWWVRLVGPAFFLWAVWAASDVLVALDKGESFGPTMVRGMGRMGGGLLLGAWCSVLFQPMMLHLIGNNFLEARGVRLGYTVENLVLVLVGMALLMLARRGRALQTKLDGFV